MKKKYDLVNLVYCKEGKNNGAICVSLGNNLRKYYAEGISNHRKLDFSSYRYERY